MTEDVKICVSARADFFEKYYIVPENLKADVEAYIRDINTLGESSNNASEFEQAFIQEGFSDKFTVLLTCCMPKAVELSPEEKKAAKQKAKELYIENGGSLAKDITKDVMDTVGVELNEEMIAQRRKIMIDADVYDDYTRATNYVDNAGSLFRLLKRKLGKKK